MERDEFLILELVMIAIIAFNLLEEHYNSLCYLVV
jgi:hypothetical protein